MSLLRGWIAQHVEQSLAEALVWLKSTHSGANNADNSHNQFSYEQDKLVIKIGNSVLTQLISVSLLLLELLEYSQVLSIHIFTDQQSPRFYSVHDCI